MIIWGSSLEKAVSNLLFTRTGPKTPTSLHLAPSTANILHICLPLSCLFPFLLLAILMRDSVYLPTYLPSYLSFSDMTFYNPKHNCWYLLKTRSLPYIPRYNPPNQEVNSYTILLPNSQDRLHPNSNPCKQYLFSPF